MDFIAYCALWFNNDAWLTECPNVSSFVYTKCSENIPLYQKIEHSNKMTVFHHTDSLHCVSFSKTPGSLHILIFSRRDEYFRALCWPG